MIDPLEKALTFGDGGGPPASIEVSSSERPADVPDPVLLEPLGFGTAPKRIIAINSALRALEGGDCVTAREILLGLQRARPNELRESA